MAVKLKFLRKKAKQQFVKFKIKTGMTFQVNTNESGFVTFAKKLE
jgi:hypothetical protein